jgi:hypothetical protein
MHSGRRRRFLSGNSVTDQLCGHTTHNGIRGNRSRDHRTRGDHRACADLDPFKDDCICANPDIFSDGDRSTGFAGIAAVNAKRRAVIMVNKTAAAGNGAVVPGPG